jgi:DNA excision repair protein ERCC-3
MNEQTLEEYNPDNGKIQKLEKIVNQADELLGDIEKETKEKRKKAKDLIIENIDLSEIEEEHLEPFLDKPYKILPKAKNEAFVVVPKFIPFNVGWLHDKDPAWKVFVVNKYVDWINDLPEDIKDRVGIDAKYDNARVDDGEIEFSSTEEREQAWDDFGGRDGGLTQRSGDKKIKVQNDKEFDVIAELIDKGNLPFTPQPVQKEDLREYEGSVELRDYQERAWEKFKDTGMVGIYWSPGAGKTFVSLYAGDRIEGKKLVVVPSNTLKEQWLQRIIEFCNTPECPKCDSQEFKVKNESIVCADCGGMEWNEWEVRTYQYITQYHMDEYQKKDFALTIFDECHHLPANSFSKLATINTKYRMGLSASPYREDGRTEYIFALTGYPVGLKWRELIEVGAVQEPDTSLYLYSTKNRKWKDLQKVIDSLTGKILVFCDSIDEGKRISKKLGVPFVHGKTTNRMEKFDDNRVVVSSRVGDEGLSKDIHAVVEYDFHGSSRRQEAQRAGRVMHGEGEGKHIIMMTDEEFEKYESRLYSLEEQGFDIQHERRK